MLAQLQRVHEEQQEALAVLAAEVSKPAPDPASLSNARLNVTRVTGRRRALIDCRITPCLHDVAVADARKLEDLRIEAAKLAVLTSEHIAAWTMTNILADWEGYKYASMTLSAAIQRRMANEKAILYPLLRSRPNEAAILQAS